MLICALGHVAAMRDIAASGITRRQLGAELRSGRVLRPARGVYACAHLDAGMLAAARAGCRIDCVTMLARHDVWSGIAPAGVHLRARPGRHHGVVPTGAVMHWATPSGSGGHPLEVPVVDALLQAMRCLGPYDALASIESALHAQRLDEAGLGRLVALAPGWMLPCLARLDRGGQSGLETHSRLLLQDAGYRVRTQVHIPGTSPLDLLVDDCVGVETDGAKAHESRFMHDRSKDIVIEGWGIRVLRIGSPHIFESWPDTLATIERMVADARRRS